MFDEFLMTWIALWAYPALDKAQMFRCFFFASAVIFCRRTKSQRFKRIGEFGYWISLNHFLLCMQGARFHNDYPPASLRLIHQHRLFITRAHGCHRFDHHVFTSLNSLHSTRPLGHALGNHWPERIGQGSQRHWCSHGIHHLRLYQRCCSKAICLL